MTRNNQFGRTMIEVLAVLAILGMVSATILQAIGRTFDKTKVSRICQQIVELQKNVNSRYAVDGTYKYMTVDDLVKERIIPTDMIGARGEIYHAYKSAVEINTADAGGHNGEDKAFRVVFKKIPRHVCMELLAINWQANNTTDLISITVGAKTYYWPDGNAARVSNDTLPLDMIKAGPLCTGDNMEIEWVFY
ncbi:MAG: type II secretion system GspH family protein [Lactobacillus sp.]|jgi:prepilin-type N-terminal cleavage/methylation domain-containing protein|nr:type II secretion system GspH family protein [Lactobacillus sp.]